MVGQRHIMQLQGSTVKQGVSGFESAGTIRIQDLEDTRDRPGEFAERRARPRDEILKHLLAVVGESCTTLSVISADDLLTVKNIQGMNVSKMHAMLHSVTHFQGHGPQTGTTESTLQTGDRDFPSRCDSLRRFSQRRRRGPVGSVSWDENGTGRGRDRTVSRSL